MHLLGFITRIYRDARSTERQKKTHFTLIMNFNFNINVFISVTVRTAIRLAAVCAVYRAGRAMDRNMQPVHLNCSCLLPAALTQQDVFCQDGLQTAVGTGFSGGLWTAAVQQSTTAVSRSAAAIVYHLHI